MSLGTDAAYARAHSQIKSNSSHRAVSIQLHLADSNVNQLILLSGKYEIR